MVDLCEEVIARLRQAENPDEVNTIVNQSIESNEQTGYRNPEMFIMNMILMLRVSIAEDPQAAALENFKEAERVFRILQDKNRRTVL